MSAESLNVCCRHSSNIQLTITSPSVFYLGPYFSLVAMSSPHHINKQGIIIKPYHPHKWIQRVFPSLWSLRRSYRHQELRIEKLSLHRPWPHRTQQSSLRSVVDGGSEGLPLMTTWLRFSDKDKAVVETKDHRLRPGVLFRFLSLFFPNNFPFRYPKKFRKMKFCI